jgi:hypothetical protein
MLIINWKLALIVLGILPVLLVIAIEFRKRILKEFRNVRKMNSKIVGSYNETITGVRVIKGLGREDNNLAEFSGLTEKMYRSSFRAAWLSALFLPVVRRIAGTGGRAKHWQHPGFCQLRHIHDVAHPGFSKGVRRNATFHRLRREDLLAYRCRP